MARPTRLSSPILRVEPHKGESAVRKKYLLPSLSYKEKIFFEYLLIDEVYKQRWYAVLRLDLWKSEGLITIQ